MLRDERASNLLFLLTLPLSMGCPGAEVDDDTTTGPSTMNPTTNNNNDTGSTGPEPTSSEGGPTSSTSPGLDSTTEPYTTTEYMETEGYSCAEIMLPKVGPISAGCMQYAPLTVECYYYGDPECLPVAEAYCQYVIDTNATMFGETCRTAFEELFVCLSMLSCEELADKTDDCPDQLMGLEMNCMKM